MLRAKTILTFFLFKFFLFCELTLLLLLPVLTVNVIDIYLKDIVFVSRTYSCFCRLNHQNLKRYVT